MAVNWWARGEYEDVVGNYQADAGLSDTAGADLINSAASITAMESTPIGEPPADFSTVAVYDSRPVNGYDFNISQIVSAVYPGTGAISTWSVTFDVPNGYRMVPREWEIYLDGFPGGSPLNSTCIITQNNAGIPNSTQLVVGAGTTRPIKTFFICEENTIFGATGQIALLPAYTGQVYIAVYGNLLPVTDVPLPFSVCNKTGYAT
jgi:hypothetical protein